MDSVTSTWGGVATGLFSKRCDCCQNLDIIATIEVNFIVMPSNVEKPFCGQYFLRNDWTLTCTQKELWDLYKNFRFLFLYIFYDLIEFESKRFCATFVFARNAKSFAIAIILFSFFFSTAFLAGLVKNYFQIFLQLLL